MNTFARIMGRRNAKDVKTLKAATTNLEEASTELKKDKLSHYDTVALMVADTSLEAGMSVTTLGYYTKGDGGGCFYNISATSTTLSTELSNGLHAVPFFQKTDSISIRQLGAKSNSKTFDNAPIIMKILNAKYTAFIPVGLWYCSPFAPPDNARITCENLNYRMGANISTGMSQLVAIDDCDVFIDCSNRTKLDISVVLSAATWAEDSAYKLVGTFVKLSNTQYSTFDLMINDISDVGLSMQSAWENTFKRLYFRRRIGLNPKLIKTYPILDEGDNCSQNIFYDIQSEGFGVTVLDTSELGSFTHNRIVSMLIECSIRSPFTQTSTAPTATLPLFKIGSGGNNFIDCLQINNLKQSVGAEFDGVVYEQTIFEIVDGVGNDYGFYIGKIITDYGTKAPYTLVKQTGTATYFYSYLLIDELISPTSYDVKCEIEKMNNLRIGKITQGTDGGWNKSRKRSITDWYSPFNNASVYLTSEPTSHNTEKCKVHIPTTLAVIGSIEASGGKIIKARISGTADINFSIAYTYGDTTTTATATITPDATLSVKNIFTLPASTSSRATVVVSASSTVDAFIEDLWAE